LIKGAGAMNIRQQIYGEGGLGRSPLVTVKKPRGAKADALRSITVSREERRRGDTRHGDRYRLVGECVQITHDGSTYDGRLINVCASGAMISAEFEPLPWDRAKLHLNAERAIASRVLWIRDGQIGLEFDQRIALDCSDSTQATLLRQVITRHFPDAQFETRHEAEEQGAECALEDRRLERRTPLLRLGTLHYDYESTPVRLRNISTAGATIETSAALVTGAEPFVDLGEGDSIFATVVWTSGGQAGLRFNQPFDLGQLPKARSQRGPANWKPPAYLSANAQGESGADEQWKQIPLNELNKDLDGFVKR
jgi:hypothetical protein